MPILTPLQQAASSCRGNLRALFRHHLAEDDEVVLKAADRRLRRMVDEPLVCDCSDPDPDGVDECRTCRRYCPEVTP